MKTKLYFVVCWDNKQQTWQYVLDSQRRPTMYQSIEQLKKHLYKYGGKDKDYRVVEYKLNSTALSPDKIDFLG